jgi:hypothetical protein
MVSCIAKEGQSVAQAGPSIGTTMSSPMDQINEQPRTLMLVSVEGGIYRGSDGLPIFGASEKEIHALAKVYDVGLYTIVSTSLPWFVERNRLSGIQYSSWDNRH